MVLLTPRILVLRLAWVCWLFCLLTSSCYRLRSWVSRVTSKELRILKSIYTPLGNSFISTWASSPATEVCLLPSRGKALCSAWSARLVSIVPSRSWEWLASSAGALEAPRCWVLFRMVVGVWEMSARSGCEVLQSVVCSIWLHRVSRSLRSSSLLLLLKLH